ncbi:MAG: nucleotidyltransferase domain-containing protein [Dehalococcoidia bacterium]|nr:nucleotidyltransferase domain-containing protein [Dehalococcoidia bacterium]
MLYGRADEKYYLRQIARTTGIGIGPVQRELRNLTDIGIIRRTEQGRLVFYQANPDYPVFEELKTLIKRYSTGSVVGEKRELYSTGQPSVPNTQRSIIFQKRKVAALCRRHHIRKLALFGSALRKDFRRDSDIDVLVEFQPGKTPGFAFFGIQEELASILGRKVDLNTPACLSRYFRDQVVKEAKIIYEEA